MCCTRVGFTCGDSVAGYGRSYRPVGLVYKPVCVGQKRSPATIDEMGYFSHIDGDFLSKNLTTVHMEGSIQAFTE